MPRQSEILSALSGAQVLSSLDALAGFTQLEFADEEVEKTAFRTHLGLFQFRRMPFGLKNGPSIFQRVMNGILAPYLWLFCLVYIDDIVVYSKTYEDHIIHLDKVLGAIEESGLTLSPKKCHLFYSSILLLGHQVSRLGLSTHDAKVAAIKELERPTKVTQLQAFLGMIVYFSSFIPYYASICAPLFMLLRKEAKWVWLAEHEFAFQSAKEALMAAPVLGHPIQGRPYRLYTDASDEALGCALQQIQPIAIRDLQNTRLYARLRSAYDKGLPVPKLTTTLTSKIEDSPLDSWGSTFEDTIVHVERVIGYWSRTFKDAERNYSTTEREALAAKDGLVKFQPFIEGEKIILVTDHSALQWAKTYESSNRRLAAWGAVYSAYQPGLEIVHRAGRVHSNVDPLSRLPRAAPDFHSPSRLTDPSIITSSSDNALPAGYLSEPAKRATFVTWALDDCMENSASAWAVTRQQAQQEMASPPEPDIAEGTGSQTPESRERDENSRTGSQPEVPPTEEEVDEMTARYWAAANPPPSIHVQIDGDLVQQFLLGYQDDFAFKSKWEDPQASDLHWNAGKRYYKDQDGLLFFRDADYQPRLCVPKKLQPFIMKEIHDSPLESAHAGPERFWKSLSSRFYWPRMKKDVLRFCNSCDVCQKTKHSNFNRYGLLTPNPIPSRPFESISMDFIVNLPWSADFNAILVIVDRLTKVALFLPTTTGLTAEGFAYMFVKNVVTKFGLPSSIVSDRDPRWVSDFWRAVSKYMKSKLVMSSSHHPQHDGQTEVTNKTLETMLRAYTAGERDSWAEWLHLLEFAYNSNIHSSTGASPYFLLYGFEPQTPLDIFAKNKPGSSRSMPDLPQAKSFVETLEMHRDAARTAVAKAQAKQAKSYNQRRKLRQFPIGSLVMVNPHSLEWIESKGEGAKLVQRWIGPFEVTQQINPNVYRLRMSDKYPGSPVFNGEHLRQYSSSPEEFGDRVTLPDTRTTKPASEEYEVQSIVGHRWDRSKRKMLYLVRWKDYSPLHDSWLTERDLKNAPEFLHSYQRLHKL